MSLRGATVITSQASALPIVGTSIVGRLWGGFCVIIAPPIYILCANSAKCGNNSAIFCYIMIICIENRVNLYNNNVKMQYMSQSAGLGVKINTFGPQRLDAEQGAWLVGMVEADGWFATNKNGIYVQYEMGLEQHKREMAMQNSQKDWLGVSRNVRIRKDRPDYVTLKIRAKADLINKIRPIFDKFQMIGAKKHQYRYFRTNQIEKNTIFFSDLDIAQRSLYKKDLTMHTATSKRTIEERLSRPLFDCWLVGFMNGEGCFSVYGATGEVNETISFSIGQTVDGFFLCTLVQHRLSLFDCSVYYVKSDNHYTI